MFFLRNNLGSFFMKKLVLTMPSLAVISAAHADGNFYQEIRTKIQSIRDDANIDASNKGEVAIATAFSVSLDDAILYLSKQKDGSILRIHTNTKYNGKVTKEGDIALYNKLFESIKGDTKEATLAEPNADGETFTWDVTEVDDNSIVVCRHK